MLRLGLRRTSSSSNRLAARNRRTGRQPLAQIPRQGRRANRVEARRHWIYNRRALQGQIGTTVARRCHNGWDGLGRATAWARVISSEHRLTLHALLQAMQRALLDAPNMALWLGQNKSRPNFLQHALVCSECWSAENRERRAISTVFTARARYSATVGVDSGPSPLITFAQMIKMRRRGY
jgi:hypothetical protein